MVAKDTRLRDANLYEWVQNKKNKVLCIAITEYRVGKKICGVEGLHKGGKCVSIVNTGDGSR